MKKENYWWYFYFYLIVSGLSEVIIFFYLYENTILSILELNYLLFFPYCISLVIPVIIGKIITREKEKRNELQEQIEKVNIPNLKKRPKTMIKKVYATLDYGEIRKETNKKKKEAK